MRAAGKLTNRSVETAKPGMHGDGSGLYLAVSESGRRRWVFIYRRGTKRTELGLGGYPDVTLAKAREKAAHQRSLLVDGIDPLAARKQAESVITERPSFGELADQFIDEMEPQFRNPKHVSQWRMTLRDYAAKIRPKPVDEIDTNAVMLILKPIWSKVPETAYRLRGRIERVLDYAKVKGFREGENPARWRGHLDKLLPKRAKLSRGHHAAMRFEEVPGFVATLRESKGVGALALEYTILTAARTGETLNAHWSEIDFEKAVWTVPAVRMKAGKEHRVPLSPRALAILNQLRELATGEFIFFGRSDDQPLSSMAMIMMLRRLDRSDVTVHGFRSAFRDWAAECTPYPNEVCEAALAHTIGNKAEAAYRRGDLFEKRRKLMEDWDRYCKCTPSQ